MKNALFIPQIGIFSGVSLLIFTQGRRTRGVTMTKTWKAGPGGRRCLKRTEVEARNVPLNSGEAASFVTRAGHLDSAESCEPARDSSSVRDCPKHCRAGLRGPDLSQAVSPPDRLIHAAPALKYVSPRTRFQCGCRSHFRVVRSGRRK